ncbi:MAG: hypothetical protein ACI4R9_02130 [Kiritimatiellia bacterium]
MINSVEFDIQAFEDTKKEAEKVFQKLGETPARKTIIEAANEGLVDALRRHFAMREKEMPKSTGFPWFGRSYPKRYFWRGTRGNSVSEKIRVTQSSPEQLQGQVTIDSPALKHKISDNPPPIKPKGGKKYLAIPANPISAQWDGMPRDFPGGLRLAFSKTPDGHWLPSLIAARNYKRRKKDGSESNRVSRNGNAGENDIVYWLVHKVRTRHDPNAMPDHRVQIEAATSAVRAAVRRILAR